MAKVCCVPAWWCPGGPRCIHVAASQHSDLASSIAPTLPVVHRRCPWLTRAVSPAIPVYNGILFLFVLANFSMATFMDPGVFPRGRALCGAAHLFLVTGV